MLKEFARGLCPLVRPLGTKLRIAHEGSCKHKKHQQMENSKLEVEGCAQGKNMKEGWNWSSDQRTPF